MQSEGSALWLLDDTIFIRNINMNVAKLHFRIYAAKREVKNIQLSTCRKEWGER
jgi:hypothetical protein